MGPSGSIFSDLLARLGSAMAKPRLQPGQRAPKTQTSFNLMVGLALFSVFITGFYEPLSQYFTSLRSASPEIFLESSRWKVLYGDGLCKGAAACPEELWASADHMGDKAFYSRAREFQGKVFWVGVKIDSEEKRKALEKSGTQLVIGRINAGFDIFVNGDRRLSGNGKDPLPTILPLGDSDLHGSQDLYITLKIFHNLSSFFPVALNTPSPFNGLYTTEGANAFRDNRVFLTMVRPVSLAVAALLSALAFFTLWMNVRDRNEFFVFGIFCFCLFSIQIMSWIEMGARMSREVFYEIGMQLRLFEGVLAGFLGLAYARTRIFPYLVIGATGAVSFLIMKRSFQPGTDLMIASSVLANYFVPFCFLTGAISCIVQAFLLKKSHFVPMAMAKRQERESRLIQFSLLLLLLGAVYASDAYKLITLTGAAYWYRPIQFGILALIGLFLLRDFREFDYFQAKSHRSRFHTGTMSDSLVISGFLMEIDMKESSRLYDYSAQLGHAKEIPTVWNEGAVQIAASLGGEILSTEGDAFRAFFDETVPKANIVSALNQIEAFGTEIESFGFNIEFRATIVKGSIKPIYKEINGKLFEDYDHGPGETCFKDASRYLREEKKRSCRGSVVVVEAFTAQELALDSELHFIEKEKLPVPDVGLRELCFFQVEKPEIPFKENSAA